MLIDNPGPLATNGRAMNMTRTTVGPHFSEGSRQLWLIMERDGTSAESLRARLGFARGVLNRHLYGDQRPDLESAYRILDKTGVEPRLFLQQPKRRFVLPGCRPRPRQRTLKSERPRQRHRPAA